MLAPIWKLHSFFINPRWALTLIVTTQDYPSACRIAARAAAFYDMDFAIAPLCAVSVDLRHNPRALYVSTGAILPNHAEKQEYRENCDDGCGTSIYIVNPIVRYHVANLSTEK
jgi:hypothetical protein